MSSRASALRKIFGIVGWCCLIGCQSSTKTPTPAKGPVNRVQAVRQLPSEKVSSWQLDGNSFPDGVLALTWDDGPDTHTLELAEFLRDRNISGTFFVVRKWERGVSDDPGMGKDAFRTGYVEVPILEQLVRLGHRLGNHTSNHRLLTRIAPHLASEQLEVNQRSLEPYLTDDFRIFRAPGGDWNKSVAQAVNSNPTLASLVGPIRWDIDAKDWQSSVECSSKVPAAECENHAGILRTKPAVVARKYLDAIERRGHGIVLLHDRVGDVGSRYSLDVARALVPQLEARGFVFAAPVLSFSPLRLRTSNQLPAGSSERPEARVTNSDTGNCAASLAISPFFGMIRLRSNLADVDGDNRADCCTVAPEGVLCALSTGSSFGSPERWTVDSNFGLADERGWFRDPAYYETIRFADINGDGRADICGRAADGVTCSLSRGRSFTRGTNWLSEGMSDSDGWLARNPSSLQLVDVNRDGRADLCISETNSLDCGLAP